MVGKGSIFRVELDNVEEASFIEQTDSKVNDATAQIVFEPSTILLAEDILLNRELIKGFLEGYDLQLLEATNGREAVEMARQSKPMLILMDIKMPEMDGSTAIGILKNDPATQSIPIVAVTASIMKSEEKKIESSCDGILLNTNHQIRFNGRPHSLLKTLPDHCFRSCRQSSKRSVFRYRWRKYS